MWCAVTCLCSLCSLSVSCLQKNHWRVWKTTEFRWHGHGWPAVWSPVVALSCCIVRTHLAQFCCHFIMNHAVKRVEVQQIFWVCTLHLITGTFTKFYMISQQPYQYGMLLLVGKLVFVNNILCHSFLLHVLTNTAQLWQPGYNMKFKVFTVLNIRITDFCDVTLCSLVHKYQHFRGTC